MSRFGTNRWMGERRPRRAVGSRAGVAKPVHIGNRTIVVPTELVDDQSRSVGLVIQTRAVL